jgi:hypothetical protein
MESLSLQKGVWKRGLTARRDWEEIQKAGDEVGDCYEHFMVQLFFHNIRFPGLLDT